MRRHKRWKKLTYQQALGAQYALRMAYTWPGFTGEAARMLVDLIDETTAELKAKQPATRPPKPKGRKPRASLWSIHAPGRNDVEPRLKPRAKSKKRAKR